MAIVRNNSNKDIILRWSLLKEELRIPANSVANIDDYIATFFFGYQLPDRDKYKALFLSRLLVAGTEGFTEEDFDKIEFEPPNVVKKKG